MKNETKKQKVERISHAVASSWLANSERVLGCKDMNWTPGKLSETSERALMNMTAEFSNLLPWTTIRFNAVAMAKEMIFLYPEKFPLTIAFFSNKS